MRTLVTLIGCLALTSSSAIALDSRFASDAMVAAKNIQRDATLVSLAAKSKKIDTADVKVKIDAMNDDVRALQDLVARFEAENPELSSRDRDDWNVIRTKVQLIEIFHARKKELADQNPAENRRLIRAHADGVAKRAAVLHDSLARLARSPQS